MTDESTVDDAADWPKLVWILDNRDETNPVPIATCPLPRSDAYQDRGGRFGAHNMHENTPAPTSWIRPDRPRHVLQRRAARLRHLQSVPAEGGRHSCRRRRRSRHAALDPAQRRVRRRARDRLHGRPPCSAGSTSWRWISERLAAGRSAAVASAANAERSDSNAVRVQRTPHALNSRIIRRPLPQGERPRAGRSTDTGMLDLFPSRDAGPFGRRQKRARRAHPGHGGHRLSRRRQDHAGAAFLDDAGRRATPPSSSTNSARSASTTRCCASSADETVLLGNGCVCCTMRSDLQVALRRLSPTASAAPCRLSGAW